MPSDFPDHRFFKVEKVIENVLKQNNLQDVLYFSRILNNWKVIIGEPLSKKAFPLKLEKKVLFIGVEDSAYSHHLKYFETNILELIASPEICGDGAVRKVRFRTVEIKNKATSVPVAQPSRKTGQPVNESDRARVDETATQITDRRLQKMFARYMGKIVSK